MSTGVEYKPLNNNGDGYREPAQHAPFEGRFSPLRSRGNANAIDIAVA